MKTAKFVCTREPKEAAPHFDWPVNGKMEVVIPEFDENGYPVYEGSLEFVKHFISEDPTCFLVSAEPVTGFVRDDFYGQKVRIFKPCKRVSRRVVTGEDAEGNDITEIVWEWAEGGVPAVKSPTLKYTDLEKLMVEKFGDSKKFEELSKAYYQELKKTSGKLDADQLAEFTNRVNAAIAAS